MDSFHLTCERYFAPKKTGFSRPACRSICPWVTTPGSRPRNPLQQLILSQLAWEAFLVPGSAEGETKLKPEALQAPDKFKAAAAQMETAMAKLVGLAKGGDMKAIKGQFGEVGKSCKGCHEQFKAK